MIRWYGETTVKELKEALAEYDDNDVVEIFSNGGDWSMAELNIVRCGNVVETLMVVEEDE